MTSSRIRDEDAGTFSSRRGHTSQLSISDPSHHVTEAIGTLYGDEDVSGSEDGGGRPLSFVDGPSFNEQIQRPSRLETRPSSTSVFGQDHISDDDSQRSLTRSLSNEPYGSHKPREDQESYLKKSQTLHIPSSNNRNSRQFDRDTPVPASAPMARRDVQADSAVSQFPLTNIDNPNDIAQELSNLQALRRMSMDVGNSIDPDMPPMALSAMPVIAPSGDDDENDPSRLLWVPARVHPELAPSEFKSFLENRVNSIGRRSGDSLLSIDGELPRNDSEARIRRRKSMLSRQIDTSAGQGASGYVDGAESLERRRSSGGSLNPELSLDELVKDPARAVKKIAEEAQVGNGGGGGTADDLPILPMAPGMGLRRSTRTTYRKGGSIRSGDWVPFSKRMAQRQQDGETHDSPDVFDRDAPEGHGMSPVEPGQPPEKYTRPIRSIRRQRSFTQDSPQDNAGVDGAIRDDTEPQVTSPSPMPEPLSVRGKPTNAPPTAMENLSQTGSRDMPVQQHPRTFPQRSSSQNAGSSRFEATTKAPDAVVEEASASQSSRHAAPPTNQYNIRRSASQVQYSSKSLPFYQKPQSDNSGSSSALMSGDSSRTDNLTVIPTFNQNDRKSEKKSKKDRDDDSASSSSKSGGAWKWLKGVTDDKDRKKEEGKRAKAKALVEKSSDNARLDVIQSSIDRTTSKGRESLVLDRDNLDPRLLEERKKESHRKTDSKKEKDGSIFLSIFGGSKRKEEKDKTSKKIQHLQVPEEPVYKPLQPDVDYHWTRFPLLEERAIYRMAHIKLANPRRPLLSQVLLSNFMYSYLAIVQAMHPQMNVPTSPQQKRLEDEARRKRREQDYNAQRQANDDEGDNSLEQYNFDYHRAAVQYAESSSDSQVDYVDEAQIYEDEHGNEHQEEYDYDNQETYGHSVKDYYKYQGNDSDRSRHGGDGMW